jgi:hypothetical protein
MENYYNYFTEIEQYYQTRRETFTLLSTLDWVLIETWKDQGLPLEIVLRGMDRAFSKAKRRISSLAYCASAVAEVAEENRDLRAEEPAPPEFAPQEVRDYLGRLAAGIRRVSASFPEFGERIDGIAQSVGELDASRTRDCESALNALEDKLISVISVASPDETLVEVRQSVNRELDAFRSRMTVEQLSMLEQQLGKRKLMEHFSVPRLSHFYLI